MSDEETDKWHFVLDTFDLHEHDKMLKFAKSTLTGDLLDIALEKLHSKGAFRKFKDFLIYNELSDKYYDFLENEKVKIIKRNLERNKIDYIDDYTQDIE